MSKEEKTPAKKSNEVAKAFVEGKQELSLQQMGAILKDLELDEDMEVTSEYLKIEVGEEVRAFFLEMTSIKKIDGEDGETTPAVRLCLEDGTLAINADAVIVSTCRQFKPNTPIAIRCTGESGKTGRKYKTFKIFKLPV